MNSLRAHGPDLGIDRMIRTARLVPEIIWYRRESKNGHSTVRFHLSNRANRDQVREALVFWADNSIATRRHIVGETETQT